MDRPSPEKVMWAKVKASHSPVIRCCQGPLEEDVNRASGSPLSKLISWFWNFSEHQSNNGEGLRFGGRRAQGLHCGPSDYVKGVSLLPASQD